jgi:hypothetical protein
VTFFFDRIIAVGIAIQLRAEGHHIIHLEERFPASTRDVDWIPVVGQEGWILVTTDRRIRSRKAEKKVLRASQITAFFCDEEFSRKHSASRAQWLRDRWPSIEEHAARAQQGEHFLISWNGRITKLRAL